MTKLLKFWRNASAVAGGLKKQLVYVSTNLEQLN